jgi:tetratricopeptide (TPR) repeat protein
MFYAQIKIVFMRNKFIHIILSVTSLVFFSTDAFSQSHIDRHLDSMVLEAVEKLDKGDVKGAEELLQDVLVVNPSSDAAWYYMGEVAIHKSSIDHALKCYTEAVELDPDNFWYRYRLARLYSFLSREVAVEQYEQLIKDFPKKSDLYFEMLDLYIAQQEYEKALEAIKEIENTIGSTESLAIYAYRIYYTLGRDDEGIEYLRKYNSRYSSPVVLTILADNELAMYNDSLAIMYYNEAIDLDSSYSHALLGKAEACRIFRRYDEYFPTLNSYVETQHTPSSEKTEYLTTLVEKSDPQFIRRFMPQLDTTMLKLSQTHPGDSLVYQLRGGYYFYTGRQHEALEHMREYAGAYPESLSAAATYVECLMLVERWDELSLEGRKAFSRFPDEPAFLEMASIGDYNEGRYEKVLEACRTILDVAPRDSAKTLRAWSTMGDIYHELGDTKNAYKAYDRALNINPDYIYVLNNYAYYLSVEGKNLKKAYEMSRKTVEAEPDNATYLDTFGWILYLRGELAEAKSFFKNAMLYGGKDSAVILDHYAEVLYALKEYDMAFVYWNLALQKNDEELPGLKEKVESRKKEAGR